MANSTFPKARENDLVVQNMIDEVLVYDLITNEAHCLNKTAAFVWSCCSGDASVIDIARSAEVRFGSPVDADLVILAVTQLKDRRLLSEGSMSDAEFPSRRAMIKKVGLASAIAVPVIASIVAPQNVLAGVSCTCISPNQCNSQAGNSCPPLAFNCNPNGICVVAP